MKKAGKMWILDHDRVFAEIFSQTLDQFELENLQLALKFVTNHKIAIDGGAHYGSWTRYMAEHFDTVYAFEPHPEIYKCLKKNTEALDNVTLVESAIGQRADKINMHVGNNSGASYIDTAPIAGTIPMVTIDSYNLDNVGFIKLDLEGYEYYAVKGALETIKRCKPIIHLEDKHCSRYVVKEGDVIREIKKLGAKRLARYNQRDYILGWTQ